MIKVRIPQMLAGWVEPRQLEFSASGANVLEVLENLCEMQPKLRPHFFNQAGHLGDHPWIFVLNSEVVVPETDVNDGDILEITAAISGGTDIKAMAFSKSEVKRYARHLSLPQVGRIGQGKLKRSRVLVIGVGGLGSPIALYLAAAGVGHIGIVDPDLVEESNLQRQIIHDVSWVGKPKVASAQEHMIKLNPYITVVPIEGIVEEDTADGLVGDYDIVVDGTDNFETRAMINRVTRRLAKPLIFGAVFQFSGQVSVFNTDPQAPCYQCLFPKLPTGDLAPNCAAGGVVGVVPGIVGLFQASEVIKLILGIGTPLVGRMLSIDALEGTTREIRFKQRSDCPICGTGCTETSSGAIMCQTDILTYQPRPAQIVSPQALAAILQGPNAPTLLDVREPGELEIGRIDDAINIPVAHLASKLSLLDPERDYVVFCRSGARSARALGVLDSAGFRKIRHLDGGLLRWAGEIDHDMVIV